MAAADNAILVDTSGGAATLTLPVPTSGRVLKIKDATGNANTNNITILPHAAEKIDGASSLVMGASRESIDLISNGTDWFIDAYYTTTSAGTVTSVALTVPAFLSVAGSPVTSSGTLAVSLSGSALPVVNGGTGLTAFTTGDILYCSASNVLSKLSIGSTNNALVVTAGVPAWSSGTLTGSNSGDVTLAAFGSTPSANAASLSGQVLTLQPADATHPGGVSTASQTFAGDKTLTGNTLIAQATASQATIGVSASSAQHLINGGLRVTTNSVSGTYAIV